MSSEYNQGSKHTLESARALEGQERWSHVSEIRCFRYSCWSFRGPRWLFDFFVLSTFVHQQLETFFLHGSYHKVLKVYSLQKRGELWAMGTEGMNSRNTHNLLYILWFSPMLFRSQVERHLDSPLSTQMLGSLHRVLVFCSCCTKLPQL